MLKISAMVAIVLLVAFGVVINMDREPSQSVATLGDTPLAGVEQFQADPNTGLEDRVAALESALVLQNRQNQALQQRVDELEQSLGDMSQRRAGSPLAAGGNPLANSTAANLAGRLGIADNTQSALVAAGFAEYRAEEIAAEIERIRTETMAKLAEGEERPNINQLRAELSSELRQSLGDYEYEQYLEATGQPTSASVRAVQEDSAAAAVGIQAGDEIISYAGERIFNSAELAAKTQDGVTVDNVLVEVKRDGVIHQYTLPAGTLGVIVGGGRGQFGGGPGGR